MKAQSGSVEELQQAKEQNEELQSKIEVEKVKLSAVELELDQALKEKGRMNKGNPGG